MKKVIVIILVAVTIKLLYLLYAWLLGYGYSLEVFKRNDSYWYETIAVKGHSKITPDQLGSCKEGELKQSYYAFFPLYPLILGASILITKMTFNYIAFFYSVAFSLLLFVLFYKFIRKLYGSEDIAFKATLVLMLFPFHYYFSVYYSEALFLLLLIASFYSLLLKRMLLFSVLSSFLVLVRPNGLFMLVPLFIFFVERWHLFDEFRSGKLKFKQYLNLSYFAVPVIIFILYCTYLKIMTGDFFAYKTAQAGWCRETVLPWTPILRSSNWMEYFNSGYLLMFFAIAVLFIKKIPLSFVALIFISLLLPLTANSITSPRFISAVFVFSLIFGKMLHKTNRSLNVIFYFLMFILQLVTFQFWLSGSQFSY